MQRRMQLFIKIDIFKIDKSRGETIHEGWGGTCIENDQIIIKNEKYPTINVQNVFVLKS